MEEQVRILILGAGPTGLGAARRLQEHGETSFLVAEAESFPGGLATSYQDDQGFTWDVGGHVQFSHYPYFDRVMDEALGVDGWNHHERESWNWIAGKFVPYPFQMNLRHLPKDLLWKCLQGLIALKTNPPKSKPKTFLEWIHQSFGAGLAEVYMEPYNFKVWAHPLDQMDTTWMGERVATVDLERLVENILFERDDVSWGPNSTFRFPKKGGTGAIWRAVAARVDSAKFRYRQRVVAVDPKNRSVTFSSGFKVRYQQLLSTIALDDLIRLGGSGFSADAHQQSEKLSYSSTHVIGIGMEGSPTPALQKKCWMYFPESNCPFYRVTVFSNYSSENVPQPGRQWSLMAEIAESGYKRVNRQELMDQTIQGMLATGLISDPKTIISRWQFCAPHGYPTPFLGRDSVLKSLRAELEPQQIYSRGRFGGWRYEVSNQDHSFMQGVEWADWIIQGLGETTYPRD